MPSLEVSTSVNFSVEGFFGIFVSPFTQPRRILHLLCFLNLVLYTKMTYARSRGEACGQGRVL